MPSGLSFSIGMGTDAVTAIVFESRCFWFGHVWQENWYIDCTFSSISPLPFLSSFYPFIRPFMGIVTPLITSRGHSLHMAAILAATGFLEARPKVEKPSEEEDPAPWFSSKNPTPQKMVRQPSESAGKPINMITGNGKACHVVWIVLSISLNRLAYVCSMAHTDHITYYFSKI